MAPYGSCIIKKQVLLFHLTNHYALVFALREWRKPPDARRGNDAAMSGAGAGRAFRDDGRGALGAGGEVHGSGSSDPAGEGGWTRQILTSRKGQRPTVWMDFQEARKILLGWEGYKILAVQEGKAGLQL